MTIPGVERSPGESRSRRSARSRRGGPTPGASSSTAVSDASSGPRPSRAGTTATAQALHGAFGARPFTTAEARDLGISADRLASATMAGTIHRLERGTYVIDDPSRRTLLAHLQSELAERGITAIVGGCSAAHIWDIPIIGTGGPAKDCTPMLWIPPGSMRPGIRHGVHYVAGHIPQESTIAAADGLILTSALRTAIDVVRLARLPRALALTTLNGGLRAQLAASARVPLAHAGVITRLAQDCITQDRLGDELAAVVAAAPKWGIRWVRDCLPFVDARLENALESLSWGRFIDAGITLPEPQAWLQGASGRWWRVDFWWPDLGLIGEADGMVKYTDAQVLADEKARQLDLEGTGRSMFRWGWAHAIRDHDPLFAGLIARIRSAAS